MTELQLAAYWQLYDEQGAHSVTEIREWSARPRREHRLLYACMGPHKRYLRDLADDWAWTEAGHEDELDVEPLAACNSEALDDLSN
jgi:hypothetical protein